MRSSVPKIPIEGDVVASPLVSVLNDSEQIQAKVEECAQELSSVNAVITNEIIDHLPLVLIEQALEQSEKVEDKVQECADDLSLVNQALTDEINQRRKLERKLAVSEFELADTRAELADTQLQEKKARHLGFHDDVTGLPNRKLFKDRLRTALFQAKRYSWRLAVMFIDLDKFKIINDTYGHEAGDKVLKIVSERLLTMVRDADTVGRLGGDEFIYLMLEIKDNADAANTADKIFQSIGQPYEFNGLKLTVKPSIGIAFYPEDGKSAATLINNADGAMYSAKRSGEGIFFHVSR